MTALLIIDERNCHRYLEQIVEIENLSFPSPWSLRLFEEEIRNPISHFWLLAVEGVPVSYICFWLIPGEIQLISLAVHPDQRGRGFARFMLEKMIELGVSRGIQTVWLEVRTSNLAAQRLYSRQGFKETGRRARYYKDTNEDAIVMALDCSRRESPHLPASRGESP